jgi:spermidine/putrescine transport system substrate-binding protein
MAAKSSLSPEARALVRAQMSRRSVLMGAGGLSAAALLAACGTSGEQGGDQLTAPQDRSDQEKRVRWANWTLYLDTDDDGNYPTLQRFEEESGITVTYAEAIEDNDMFYGIHQEDLKRGKDIKYDVVTPTDWMAGRFIRQGWTQKLNKSNIPNWENILPNLRDVGFDSGREHSLTWQSGFAVVAWNKQRVPQGIKSVSDLWKPELKGRVEVLSEMRDTIGLIMLDQGVSPEDNFTGDQFYNALDVLQKQVDSGQIRQVKGNSYKEDLISGDALAVIGWSGDIFQINAEEGDRWGVAIPEGGATLWSDNMLIPIGSPYKTNAEKLMNWYYDPAIAAEVAAWVNYISPVQGAQEEMEKLDPELAESEWIFPNDEMLAKSHVFRPLNADEETEYSSAFLSAIGK